MTARAAALALALATLPANGEEGAAPPEADTPLYAVQGWTPPREASKGCVARSIRPPQFAGRTIAKFAVRPGGRVTDFRLLGPEAPDVARAVEDAVRACDWVPGRDADGKPVAMWVIVPVRFVNPNPVAVLREGEGNPPLSRLPAEESPGCVRLHFESMGVKGMYGSIAVRFRVTPEGAAEQFSFAPGDMPAQTRLKLIDAFSTCGWVPGLDKEGKPVAAWVVVPVEPKH